MKNNRSKSESKSRKITVKAKAAPALRFTPTAWAKLLYLRDLGPTEVGGFGISSSNDVLLVEDFVLVKQQCDWASVVFDDEAVADFFEEQVDAGRQPEEFGRIWIHTHPGNSAQPSGTDEATFKRVFGGSDWAVMFILAQGGATYARLRFNVGPGGLMNVPVEVDYSGQFAAANYVDWDNEYLRAVSCDADSLDASDTQRIIDLPGEDFYWDAGLIDGFEEDDYLDGDRWMFMPWGKEVADGTIF